MTQITESKPLENMPLGNRPLENKSFMSYNIAGIPLYMLAPMVLAIYGAMGLGILSDDILGTVTAMLALGIVLGELGERIPIWKDYLGGGGVLAFLGSALLVYWNILPIKYTEAITFFYDEYSFHTFFITMMIVSAVLAVNRGQLIKAFSGYIPAIMGGFLMAGVFGLLGGMLCGMDIKTILTLYILPIMGGGNGAGAIPLAQMWESIMGSGRDAYYSQALAILILANNFAILGAVVLNILGKKYPNLTGNGELLRDAAKYIDPVAEAKNTAAEITLHDVASGMFMGGVIYALASFLSEVALPSIGGIPIHMYAYMVILCAIFNICNFIPGKMKRGVKQVSSFLTKPLMWMCMAGVGIAMTDISELLAVLNINTLIVCLFVITGAIIGSGAVGYMFGFNFVESAISAGLCMANKGGSGDIQVLTAGKRLELMSYAQISSRIGGGIILVIAGFIFTLFK
ncbi:MAG: 2-hydroxycarboxylate transporter family protein [Clostridia bacterium]